MRQITDTILMIKPANFRYNEETAQNNHFQDASGKEEITEIHKSALTEFEAMVSTLKSHGINVVVIDDTATPKKPDAIFPNNWFSTHQNGIIIQYPMYAPNRRHERREDILKKLEADFGFNKTYDFNYYEEDGQFLEGTGSMILDRVNRINYACLSPRTSVQILSKFSILMSYEAVHFTAKDDSANDIYHTNVMMSVGEDIAVICSECIDEEDRPRVLAKLTVTGKTIVHITPDQMNRFAGNMLEVENVNGQRFIIMSQTAYKSLTKEQIETISQFNTILSIPIDTIEKYGGGSVRCMMAEIFPPEPKK